MRHFLTLKDFSKAEILDEIIKKKNLFENQKNIYKEKENQRIDTFYHYTYTNHSIKYDSDKTSSNVSP